MTSETTYAELSFKNESKSSGTKERPPAAPKEKTSLNKSNPSFPKLLFASLLVLLLLLAISFFIAFIIFFQKYSQLLKEKKTAKELPHTELECLKENVTMEGKDWSCCPKDWKPFSSNCYFISNTTRNWTESEKNCSAMKAHLLVVNTKDEQDFIIRNVDTSPAYYIGLSDPKGKRDWQWVDQTPYNESVTFWHSSEPSNLNERCVILHFRHQLREWGWNDVPCNEHHKLLCKMMKIYL
ncbi:C-type lectin domain family 4 member A isoform X1 [Prionailurus viverrinus]|uniref:C-type lectin domain family 4 member A n=1 Tax=Prionailurus bengalensis TaxID=37029 RepID=UPI001CA868EF|nr:C-type lectin domain family 4 member A [Prionailurus bengalensis]XP_043417402.1 C-type lectin domain family 4 member A [Prionailurus bengalensis]XP_043417403.1 C-type lectin domain family 4 member A [Prionailurus bengalensis]XP_047723606.1 C-type lectin domain family 4 member A isoform X1 [Prionailurus viverrinus]XP_047723607.1 C-type lectin domain family 4 member A isoform X1 [Prionailurus viverrinus]XP_047723608.1 C-type lectin domain family 4 member A isoform X1 [Prionailurus viverrinus]